MDTTKLIVEYLVAGTLVLGSTLFAVASWFPSEIKKLFDLPTQQQSIFANQVILATIFIALAYAIGIVSEYVGDIAFDWLITRIKRRRMAKYVKKHAAIIKDNPILGPFVKQPEEKRDLDELAACVGEMRFFIMNHSTSLYADIAAQISRFRLIRVLFLVEVLTFIAAIGQLRYGFTLFWFVSFLLIVAIGAANYWAIESRFNRYCRAVERSYLVLMKEAE